MPGRRLNTSLPAPADCVPGEDSPAPIRESGLSRQIAEYRRPWKLFSLLLGLWLLVAGAFHYRAPDWDVPISLVMALFAYLTASWSMRVVLERQWKKFPLMLLFTWFTVDGCYWLYWHFQNPQALELMRSVNFPASLSLYGMCGLAWYFQGDLRQFMRAARELWRVGRVE
jgi:hypothetical protein